MSYESLVNLLEYFSVNSHRKIIDSGYSCPEEAGGNNIYNLFKMLTCFTFLHKTTKQNKNLLSLDCDDSHFPNEKVRKLKLGKFIKLSQGFMPNN